VGSLGQREGGLARAGAEGKSGPGAVHAGEERREARAEGRGELAARGPCGRGKRGPDRERREGREGVGWAKKRIWLPFFYSFSSPFLFLYSTNSNKSN
jgi:hypothetical protein